MASTIKLISPKGEILELEKQAAEALLRKQRQIKSGDKYRIFNPKAEPEPEPEPEEAPISEALEAKAEEDLAESPEASDPKPKKSKPKRRKPKN